ncbi:15509_t:CDS:2 [Acaulospora colombiana]|uniref:15509_t:CDS:1 n=1 Tax=Acaulospora colombiana TaxID=27376 RepID=A0ACA9N6Y7_9GLOM|nr:15509_t:CDS:2 [Acaulospora colombiana]
MSESDESIIELIGIIRPMAANADGQKTIAGIFAQEKVAQETIKMMSVLGLIDEEALASALTKMVPEGTKQQAPAGPSHSNGPQGFPPASALPQTMAPLPGMGVGIPGQTLVTAALSMSQQEVDMLPPQQRAIFMQLEDEEACIHSTSKRSIVGKRSLTWPPHKCTSLVQDCIARPG